MNAENEQTSDPVNAVVSVRFGVLRFSGCNDHPDRVDLSCAQIRTSSGVPLSASEVWEVLKELCDVSSIGKSRQTAIERASEVH
jgi:hypothetical protein